MSTTPPDAATSTRFRHTTRSLPTTISLSPAKRGEIESRAVSPARYSALSSPISRPSGVSVVAWSTYQPEVNS
jgi:hypothetical protein